MIDILIKDILPIFVIMFLGFMAGKKKVFKTEDSKVLNKLVLTYALPAALFVSIVKADSAMLFDDLKLTVVSLVVITGMFLWAYYSCYKFFKHSKSEAAVCALISGSPTIGFLGFAILEPIYGSTATTGLVVAIVSIVVNAVNIPIGLALLNNGRGDDTNGVKKTNPVVDALKEPVCWAPILAVILVLLDIKFPAILDPNFELIAKANSGVAVFAAGLTLSGMKFQLDKEVVYNTIQKLILMPAVLLIVGLLFHMETDKLQMMVLAGALPPAFSGIIIGNQNQLYERTGTSSLAFSILLFIFAAPFWIWVTRMFA
ncbi:MAG: transporter YfdV [Bacteroidaceae bacterium]|nr:transporter YfdV [Bacteroidaceae bacterium]MBR6622130.1 transporter YfdV [Bacteroides sp.]